MALSVNKHFKLEALLFSTRKIAIIFGFYKVFLLAQRRRLCVRHVAKLNVIDIYNFEVRSMFSVATHPFGSSNFIRFYYAPLLFTVLVSLFLLFPLSYSQPMQFSPCFMLIFCFTCTLSVMCKYDRVTRRTTVKQLRFNNPIFYRPQDSAAVKIMAIVKGLLLLCCGHRLHCEFASALKS